MTTWRNRHDANPGTEAPATPVAGARRDYARTTAPTPRSEPIEAGGVFLGIAVEHELGVRFIAMDDRVTDMDQSIWPTLGYARRSARQLLRSGCAATSP